MVMDYSEKKVRESKDRKPLPLQKNRPRKEPVGTFALLSVVVLVITFGAGIATGWFLFKGTHKSPPVAFVVQPAKKAETAPVAAQAQQPGPYAPDAPLTFYKTLAAGGKGAIGSGMNLKKPEPVAPRPAPAAPSAPAANEEGKPQPEKQAAHFAVQIASYRDKQEAEAAQTKLSGKGVAAYLVESKLPDKGVWYRIRVGKHLSKAEADGLAAKSGKGALVLPE